MELNEFTRHLKKAGKNGIDFRSDLLSNCEDGFIAMLGLLQSPKKISFCSTMFVL